MARREIKVEELIEVLHQWHKARNISQIKRSTGLDRKTIAKYIFLAEKCGFNREDDEKPYDYYLYLAGRIQNELKTPLEDAPSHKKTAIYQVLIEKLKKRPYMKPKQIYRILRKEYGYRLSYSSFNRYMNIKYPKTARNCLRLEVSAGEEAQVDFGSAGKMLDPDSGKLRRAYAFIMTLSCSRLPYVKFVFDQGQDTWVKCHIGAFEFFKGVPRRIVLDNLKSGILKVNTYDPVFNKMYGECSKYYGFVIDPAKAREAKHKGKVERKIPTLRCQFLSSHDFRDILDANIKVIDWSLYEYGMEIHGTTKKRPYEVFREEEQAKLLFLPAERFEIPIWKEAKVHPDHHIVFDKSYYSCPTRFIRKKVLVRGSFDDIKVFFEGEIVKIHKRAKTPGSFVTDEGDYPPEKSKYILKTREYYENEAKRYGESVQKLVTCILDEHAYRNLRKIQTIFGLGEKYGASVIELTAKRALFYGDYKMSTIKRILNNRLYSLSLEDEASREKPPVCLNPSFVRSSQYFKHTI